VFVIALKWLCVKSGGTHGNLKVRQVQDEAGEFQVNPKAQNESREVWPGGTVLFATSGGPIMMGQPNAHWHPPLSLPYLCAEFSLSWVHGHRE